MPLLRVLSTAAATGCGAVVVSFFLIAATAGLGGRGTARFVWLLPLHFAAVLATFAVALFVFHRRIAPWLPGPGWHWAATGVQAVLSLTAAFAVAFVTLVVLNR